MAIEPIKVDHPQFWPQRCVCGEQKGPLLDTGKEVSNERIYLCSLCSKLVAITMGFHAGPELDRLLDAGAELTQKEHELEETKAALETARAGVRSFEVTNARLTTELERETQRGDQLEQTIKDLRDNTIAQLAAVGAGGSFAPEDEAHAAPIDTARVD